jgi:hypothetical protein|tara:strand:- start:2783 stop:2920 length:138 start_codon:yes stop_codon:yes gene_type:complete
MGCGCKKKTQTNKEKIEKDKKVREAMRAFLKFKASGGGKLKSGKS